ncbi:MAG: DUF1778 domain-containing protein [Phycisphaerales bacterium]|nr:DUF1778 domain-containing protein [Phycisphaerales bacterium]
MMQPEEPKKSARLEARLSPTVFKMVRRAARLQGRSVSDFVVTAAARAAERAIRRRTVIELAGDDQERFVEALLNPPPLTEAMRRAAQAHRELIDPA